MYKVASFRTDWFNGPAVDITALGSRTLVITFYILATVCLLVMKNVQGFIHLVIAGLGAGILSPLMKNLIERNRPSEVEALAKVSSHSYPSGHSLGAAVFYLTLAMILTPLFESLSIRSAILVISFLIIISVGFTRIYLGVHYPSDILGGTLLGVAWALLVSYLVKKYLYVL